MVIVHNNSNITIIPNSFLWALTPRLAREPRQFFRHRVDSDGQDASEGGHHTVISLASNMTKASQAPNAVKALDLYCKKTNGRVLKRLGTCIGANLGQNKTSARQGILNQAKKLEVLRAQRLNNGSTSLTAIDAGVSNFAYSTFKWHKGDELPTLEDWNKMDLNQKFLPPLRTKITMDPSDTFYVGHKLTEMFTAELPIPDMFIIERQRNRSQSSTTVLEAVLMSNIIEQVFFSSLKNKQIYDSKAKLNYAVNSSNPQRMVQYWCALRSLKTLVKRSDSLDDGAEPSNAQGTQHTSRVSKVIRINLVKKILKSSLGLGDYHRCLLNSTWRANIANQVEMKKKFKLIDCIDVRPEVGAKKDDDLADSFLHGLAWMQWLRTYEQITEIILSKEGKHDEDVLTVFNRYCMELNTEWLNMSHRMKGELAELQVDDEWGRHVQEALSLELRRDAKSSSKKTKKDDKKSDLEEELI